MGGPKNKEDRFLEQDGEALPPREVMSTLAFDPTLTPPPLLPLDQPADGGDTKAIDVEPAPPQGTE